MDTRITDEHVVLMKLVTNLQYLKNGAIVSVVMAGGSSTLRCFRRRRFAVALEVADSMSASMELPDRADTNSRAAHRLMAAALDRS
ncbi:hypothetical protein [Synechococcus sp. M16CYN]|uniref:hypothetical protein n=1 Tax=Synechococcus sp. M16CYN TaxID=3103139 RepID=UPI00333E56DC